MHRTHRVRARGARVNFNTSFSLTRAGARAQPFRLTDRLGNLLLFPSRGRGTRESTCPRRKVGVQLQEYSTQKSANF